MVVKLRWAKYRFLEAIPAHHFQGLPLLEFATPRICHSQGEHHHQQQPANNFFINPASI